MSEHLFPAYELDYIPPFQCGIVNKRPLPYNRMAVFVFRAGLGFFFFLMSSISTLVPRSYLLFPYLICIENLRFWLEAFRKHPVNQFTNQALCLVKCDDAVDAVT